jgi:hypothetical protein
MKLEMSGFLIRDAETRQKSNCDAKRRAAQANEANDDPQQRGRSGRQNQIPSNGSVRKGGPMQLCSCATWQLELAHS